MTCLARMMSCQLTRGQSSLSGARATILMVGKDAADCDLVVKLLELEGYAAGAAIYTRQTSIIIAQSPPDLILLDVEAAVSEGYELVRQLKADESTSNVPIIIVTASVGRSFRLEGLDAGAEDFLNKPIDRAELWLRVRNLLRLKALSDFQKDHSAILERQVHERTGALRRFRMALDIGGDAIFLVNRRTMQYVDVNSAACALLGYSHEELLTMRPDQTSTASRKQLERVYDAVIACHPLGELDEVTMVRRDNTTLPLEARRQAYRDGEEWLIVAVLRDISERIYAAHRIKYLNRVYEFVSSINALIIRVRDRDELFNEACQIAIDEGGFHVALIEMLDSSRTKLRPVALAGKNETLVSTIEGVLAARNGEVTPMTQRAITYNEAVVSNDSQNDPRVAADDKHSEFGICSKAILPISESKNAFGALVLYSGTANFFQPVEMKLLSDLADNIAFAIGHIEERGRLDYLAHYDALTGLAIRQLFLERVSLHIRGGISGRHKVALILTDLEQFKNINDSLGRTAGDSLLKQVAEWFARDVGDVNLLARVGADRFAILLPEVKEEGNVARFLEKMAESFLQHSFGENPAGFRVAFKAGVAIFPDDGNAADVLLKNAEAALKQAKRKGERYLFHTQKMTETVASRLTLENRLREALEKDEFLLYYQPKVNLVGGAITGVEALMRWSDPRTGLVAPAQFIPMLEETGLIHDVGRWALRQAMRDYIRWRKVHNVAIPIAVNVSSLQLRDRGLIEEITEFTESHDDRLHAVGIELEITESVAMTNVEHNIKTFQSIRGLGVQIAIDDFGTGFSSLSYLSQLPIDTLKIDRSFVTNVTKGRKGLALVSTIINLAHALELNVVAEGVETEEQASLLRSLSCDEMQGYLFCKPMACHLFETTYLMRHHEV